MMMDRSNAFVVSPLPFQQRSYGMQQQQSTTMTTLYAKKRKAQKTKKAETNRPSNKMAAAIQDKPDQDEEDMLTKPDPSKPMEPTSPMDGRPDVSTMILDEETGVELLQQGKNVMDVVTRQAVKLSNDPNMRLAQLFPGVPPDIRTMHRQDWKNVEELILALEQAAMSKNNHIPKHPSVTSTGLDFLLANRDLLSRNMKLTLTRLYLKHMSLFDKQQAKRYLKLCRNFMTMENHISAPFRQMILDAESRVGPNFGNLDISTFCNGNLYERCANYIVLKGMVAHWEKKVVDADYVEKNPQKADNYLQILSVGDPKRYLPDPPILYTLRECTQVCAMAQKMTKAFVEDATLFDDLPVELRFLEQALLIPGGTPLRQFTTEEFCPKENITPEALREGLRRLSAQLDNMQIDPYGDIYNVIVRLLDALSVGTDDNSNDLYKTYLANLDPRAPGVFETYTFDHAPLSRVRFLDGQYPSATSRGMGTSIDAEEDNIFGLGGRRKVLRQEPVIDDTPYKVPKERACGRPHETGWLKLLDDDEEMQAVRFGQVKPGTIIME